MTATPKPSRATLRALGFTHLTGTTPAHIQVRTLLALHDYIDSSVDRYNPDGSHRFDAVKPEFVDLAETAPIVRAVRALEAMGFRLAPRAACRRRPGASFLSLRHPTETRVWQGANRRGAYRVERPLGATAHDSGSYYYDEPGSRDHRSGRGKA